MHITANDVDEFKDLYRAGVFTTRMMIYEIVNFKEVNPHNRRLKRFIDDRLLAIIHKYDESQPRDENGRWTDGGVNENNIDGVTDENVVTISEDSVYGGERASPINLLEEEAYGGHAIKRHVSISESELINKLENAKKSINIPFIGQFRIAGHSVGSFYNLSDANIYVNKVLLENQEQIDFVVQNKIRIPTSIN